MNLVKVLGKIGVKLYDGAGTALTSTLVSGKQSLDVNVTQTVGGGADPVGLKDSDGTTIDPATDEMLENIIGAITRIGTEHGKEVKVNVRNTTLSVELSNKNIFSIQSPVGLLPEERNRTPYQLLNMTERLL